MNIFKSAFFTALLVLAISVSVMIQAEDEPQLPVGIDDDIEPTLPIGFDGDNEEPLLPGGLDDAEFQAWSESDEEADESISLVRGFWEIRTGHRLQSPVSQRQASLAEIRLELEKDFHFAEWSGKLAADVLYDGIEKSGAVDLESGTGWFDLREGWVQRNLGQHADIKLGRQVLTWGVGDLVFINDLFPKDWNSFLIGRDEQYLKSPSDAVKMGFYSHELNINLIYTPRFDADRYIDGRRLSYFNTATGEIAGQNALVSVYKPNLRGRDDEWALRLYRQFGSYEVAFYAYSGFWKSPAGFDPSLGVATFPALRAYGSSVRGPVGRGIFSAEFGFYDSREDSSGDNPWVNNSEWRGLVGYEWEAAKDITLALQYYVEVIDQYDDYRGSLFLGQAARDRYRQLITVRVTRLAMNQNLTWSFFGFYSPTDKDYYLRPNVSYKITDNWLVEGGLNLFDGQHEHTFFGQFESNSNAYVGLRYSF